MGNAVVIVILVLIVVWAVFKTVQKYRKGGGCCGDHEEMPRRIPVHDRRESNYPYKLTLSIGGMTCENCAIRVENALNLLPDTWAKVDIAEKTAVVLTKNEPDENQLRRAVQEAGYVVMDIKK